MSKSTLIPFKRTGQVDETQPVGFDEFVEDEGFDLRHYWRVVLHYKWGILGLVFGVGLFTLVWAYSIQPVYRCCRDADDRRWQRGHCGVRGGRCAKPVPTASSLAPNTSCCDRARWPVRCSTAWARPAMRSSSRQRARQGCRVRLACLGAAFVAGAVRPGPA